MDIEKIQEQLDALRKKWIANPTKRAVIELQARPYQSALIVCYREHPQSLLPLDTKSKTSIIDS